MFTFLMSSDMRIGVGFQLEPLFTFRYTTFSVKLGFKVMSLFVAPS
jgi:hypothetical protein